MTYNTAWDVTFCEFDVQENNSRLVTELHWNCEVTDDVTEESVSAYGTVSAKDQNRVYTSPALENVPKATFLQWVHQALGDEKDEIEARLTAQLDEKLTPTTGGFVPA